MSDLLAALVAASKAGFDAPRCGWCMPDDAPEGDEWSQGSRQRCVHCLTTGLDASDPERLIGRAMAWFQPRDLNVLVGGKFVQAEAVSGSGWTCTTAEFHDGSPEGTAGALLRLVPKMSELSSTAQQEKQDV